MRVAFLVSGVGSNLRAFLEYWKNNSSVYDPVIVISNVPGVHALNIAEEFGIEHVVVNQGMYSTKERFEYALHGVLVSKKIKWVCLAGFMLLLTEHFVNSWRNQLINIHPALLPSFKGLRTHERVLKLGVRIHGCTVHFLRPEMDQGPIIAQGVVRVLPTDTAETLKKRVQCLEHILYPRSLEALVSQKIRLSNDIVLFQEGINPEDYSLFYV